MHHRQLILQTQSRNQSLTKTMKLLFICGSFLLPALSTANLRAVRQQNVSESDVDRYDQNRRLKAIEVIGSSGTPPNWALPLGQCQGDCDDDNQVRDISDHAKCCLRAALQLLHGVVITRFF